MTNRPFVFHKCTDANFMNDDRAGGAVIGASIISDGQGDGGGADRECGDGLGCQWQFHQTSSKLTYNVSVGSDEAEPSRVTVWLSIAISVIDSFGQWPRQSVLGWAPCGVMTIVTVSELVLPSSSVTTRVMTCLPTLSVTWVVAELVFSLPPDHDQS